MAEAANEDRPASQVISELMRHYIEQRRQVREGRDYLRRKFEVARKNKTDGRGHCNEEVEAEFSAGRTTGK